MAKQQPDLRIDRLGTHLFNVTRKDGSSFLKWDWDKLLGEVQAATADRKVQYVDIGDLTPDEAVNLMKTVEAKVKKTRAKKVDDTVSPAKDPVKKATAKKPAAKKKVAAKKSTK